MTVPEQMKYLTANSLHFWMMLKHFHWAVRGPRFTEMHEFFGEYADLVYGHIDPIAERIRMADVDVPADLFTKYRTADPIPSLECPRDMLDASDMMANYFCTKMRAAVTAAETASDYGTVDLLSKAIQDHEKQRWFIRQLLKDE